jgi:hypothetical protein
MGHFPPDTVLLPSPQVLPVGEPFPCHRGPLLPSPPSSARPSSVPSGRPRPRPRLKPRPMRRAHLVPSLPLGLRQWEAGQYELYRTLHTLCLVLDLRRAIIVHIEFLLVLFGLYGNFPYQKDKVQELAENRLILHLPRVACHRQPFAEGGNRLGRIVPDVGPEFHHFAYNCAATTMPPRADLVEGIVKRIGCILVVGRARQMPAHGTPEQNNNKEPLSEKCQ